MDEPMLGLLTARLADQLGDLDLARDLAPRVLDAILTWTPPTVPAREIDHIVAYAFGNRPRTGPRPAPDARLVDRLELPGPVNEQLADAVVDLRRLKPVRVFAQWEIAEVLQRKHGLDDVVSIEPSLGDAGEVIYLSTDGVARAAVEAAATDLGTVAVVAHRDHAKRCVQISRAAGMAAFVAAEVDLPKTYDALSGQPWTRARQVYLLHDMCAQLGTHRARSIADAFPRG